MAVLDMDDVGTRMQHMVELYDIWTEGLACMNNGHYLTVGDKARIEELEHAIKLLTYHMKNGYSDTTYAREINQIPAPEKVEGGRGLPLRSQQGEPSGID